MQMKYVAKKHNNSLLNVETVPTCVTTPHKSKRTPLPKNWEIEQETIQDKYSFLEDSDNKLYSYDFIPTIF